MKKFLTSIILFGLSAITLMLVLVISTAWLTKQTFDFQLPLKKNILVLGNSHPECAINDKILPDVYNLAQSGSGYFYDYLKAKEIIKNNPQIDTLIVGYSYGDIAKNMDSWIIGKDKLKFKIRNFFFLFELEDYILLLKANPIEVLVNTPQTIFYNLKMKREGYKYLGGFKRLDESKLRQAKKLIDTFKPDTSQGYSQYQINYLLKLYEICNKGDIKLILLNTPIHPLLDSIQTPLKKSYHEFAEKKLPKALLVNHSNFKLAEEYYRDLDHLNSRGANLYTRFIKANGFKNHK
tara:strand:- start:4836 stop:5714 length:879 start_codon:yes stop_codon:yes gene_type:complete